VHQLNEVIGTVLKYWNETCDTPTLAMRHPLTGWKN
jgi:hypothetical protein